MSAVCTWSVSALPLPAGQTSASVIGGDGGRYAVGTVYAPNAGSFGPRPIGSVLWDDGSLVRTAPTGQSWADVNSSGTIAGDTTAGPVRIFADGRVEQLAVSSSWGLTLPDSINAHGDIAGWARVPLGNGTTADSVVVWPADAPGTYRLLPRPFQGYAGIGTTGAHIDDQGRVAATLSSASATDQTAHGYVWRQQTAAPQRLVATNADVNVVDIVNGQVAANRIDHLPGGTFGNAIGVWNDQGQLTSTASTESYSSADSISTEGAVGGTSYVSTGPQYLPVIWNAGSKTILPLAPGTTPSGYMYKWSVNAISSGGTVAAGTKAETIPEDGLTKNYRPLIWRCA